MNNICSRYLLLIFLSVYCLHEAQAQRRQEVTVPGVVGMTLKDATEKLHRAKLRRAVRAERIADQDFATVISQIPIAGTPAQVLDIVHLEVTPKIVKVPNLTGLTRHQANAVVHKVGLQLVAVETLSKRVPGSVFDQRPPPGSRAQAGTAVYFNVAILKQMEIPSVVGIPDLVGLTLDEAGAILNQANLQLGELVEEETTRYRPGTVLRQIPEAEGQAEIETRVNLVVATVKTVAVPNVVGQPLEMSRDILSQKQLQLGPLEKEETAVQKAGTILRQIPDAGSRVRVGTPISVVVAKVKMVTVPNVVGLPVEVAKEILGRAQLRLGPAVEEKGARQATGTVLGQNLAAGIQVPMGSRVNLVVAIRKSYVANWLIILVSVLSAFAAGYVFIRVKKAKGKDIASPIEILPKKDGGTQQIETEGAPSSEGDMRIRAILDSGDQNIEAPGEIIIDERRQS
jgi:beta-lactam-binding protein with PASTA domain